MVAYPKMGGQLMIVMHQLQSFKQAHYTKLISHFDSWETLRRTQWTLIFLKTYLWLAN